MTRTRATLWWRMTKEAPILWWYAGYRLRCFVDDICYLIARCLPRQVRRWVVVNAMADATTGQYSHVEVSNVTFPELMDRMK